MLEQDLFIIYNPVTALVWGACWGSFLNVVLYRHPLGLSVVSPGSACPSCKNPIPFHHNVPVFAWLWLRGKCAACKAQISIRYPMVEMFFGLLWLACNLLYPWDILMGAGLGFALMCLLAVGWMLIRHRRAPWYLTALLAVGAAMMLISIMKTH